METPRTPDGQTLRLCFKGTVKEFRQFLADMKSWDEYMRNGHA